MIVSINLNVNSSLSESNFMNIIVRTSFKVNQSESKKVNVTMISNISEC